MARASLRWYDTEHLPGLAAVAGVASAERYRVVEGGGPAYHAVYDLADRAAFNSRQAHAAFVPYERRLARWTTEIR